MAGNPPSRILKHPGLVAVLQPTFPSSPECGVVFPQVGVTFVSGRTGVQAHVKGRQNVSGVKIAAIVELDTLAKLHNPDCRVFIRDAGFSQVRFCGRVIDFETVERLSYLLASAQSFTVCIIGAEQTDGSAFCIQTNDIPAAWIREGKQFGCERAGLGCFDISAVSCQREAP